MKPKGSENFHLIHFSHDLVIFSIYFAFIAFQLMNILVVFNYSCFHGLLLVLCWIIEMFIPIKSVQFDIAMLLPLLIPSIPSQTEETSKVYFYAYNICLV